MPCRDGGPPAEELLDLVQVRLNLVTRLLCELLTLRPKLANTSPELKSWWKEHQQNDLQRKAQERRALMAKKRARRESISQVKNSISELKQRLKVLEEEDAEDA